MAVPAVTEEPIVEAPVAAAVRRRRDRLSGPAVTDVEGSDVT
jgi:hypothetical protein